MHEAHRALLQKHFPTLLPIVQKIARVDPTLLFVVIAILTALWLSRPRR